MDEIISGVNTVSLRPVCKNTEKFKATKKKIHTFIPPDQEKFQTTVETHKNRKEHRSENF